MREIQALEISQTVTKLFCDAKYYLMDEMLAPFKKAARIEELPVTKEVLDQILQNTNISAGELYPSAMTAA
jgi:tartrate dehydratase alpha subunit/fumarate hydratase class I-like protein